MEKKRSDWNELALYITENIKELKDATSEIQNDIKLITVEVGKIQVWVKMLQYLLACGITTGVGLLLRWWFFVKGAS